MIFGIVGNRTGWTYERIKEILEKHNVYKSDVIISGGADGVDAFAQEYAKEKGCKMIIFYPDPTKLSPIRYYDRNKLIALNCDVLIAFNKQIKSGTQNTIKYAKESGKEVIEVKK